MDNPVEVTKAWLKAKVEEDPERVIGRALVAIFRRQTEEEKGNNRTKNKNGVGFSYNDGRIGSIGAKYFMKHGTLTENLMKGWLKEDKKGYPRICRYSKQLNNIANGKAHINA